MNSGLYYREACSVLWQYLSVEETCRILVDGVAHAKLMRQTPLNITVNYICSEFQILYGCVRCTVKRAKNNRMLKKQIVLFRGIAIPS
jgi:hypothetical protein